MKHRISACVAYQSVALKKRVLGIQIHSDFDQTFRNLLYNELSIDKNLSWSNKFDYLPNWNKYDFAILFYKGYYGDSPCHIRS